MDLQGGGSGDALPSAAVRGDDSGGEAFEGNS